MREVSIESIVISFVMVIALLTNIWSLTFAVDSTISQNYYKAVQYTAIPFNFLLVFLILGLLGTRNTGFSLIILIYSCALAGELTRFAIGFRDTGTDNRIFITSNVLTVFGLLFGSILSIIYVLERIEGVGKKGE